MDKQRKQYTAEFKVRIVREHLENQTPIGKLAEQYDLHPNLIYLWKKELFENAAMIFSKEKGTKSEELKIQKLEAKLQDKDSLISELVADNLKMKKKAHGEI